MAVDIADLVPTLKRSINPPGQDLFPDALDPDDYIGYLGDAFWDARMTGLLEGYTLDGQEISPTAGTTDISRDLQQILVLYAAMTIVTNELRQKNTQFRAKAGPAEFETQNSSNLLRDVLQVLEQRMNIVMKRLSDLGVVLDKYTDAVAARTQSIGYGLIDWNK